MNPLNFKLLKNTRSLEIGDKWNNIFNSTREEILKVDRMTSLELEPYIDGIVITGTISNEDKEELHSFLEQYRYYPKGKTITENDIDIDLIKVSKLMVEEGIIYHTYPNIPKCAYNSKVIQNGFWKKSNGTGDNMDIVQNITVHFYEHGDDWEISLWFNPNKFIQKHDYLKWCEPLMLFAKTYILPKMTKPYLEEIDTNVDIGVNYHDVHIVDNVNSMTVKEDTRQKGTRYINNCLKRHGEDDIGFLTSRNHKNIINTLVVYDKTYEINHKPIPSYYSPQEMNLAHDNGIDVTRFELRAYNVLECKRLLENNTYIDTDYRLYISYKDNGQWKCRAIKDCLNMVYKGVREKVTNLMLVTPEVLKNTKDCIKARNESMTHFK